ncbi:MAG: FHA domain-containing protein [Armatimonadota bacterium]|nr:FHA domain-containing protein [bacterium]
MSYDFSIDQDKTQIGTMNADTTQMVTNANATQYAANVICPVCQTPNPPSEIYCTDCGFMLSAQPVEIADIPQAQPTGKLTTVDGTQEFSLQMGENTVGRESADVLVAHNTVSRKHAKIIVEGASVFVEDMGSTNGTYVAGNRVMQGERMELKDGCEVTFGGVTFKYTAPEMPAGEPEQEASTEEPSVEPVEEQTVESDVIESDAIEPEEEPQAPVALGSMVSIDGSLSFEIMPGVNTIGRRAGSNMIVVPDSYASGHHADLTAEDGNFVLTDVGSTNGTLVNGVKLDANAPRELQPGDEITIGQTVFKIEVI